MSAENFSQFISKKAYEICYALFRVALNLKQGGSFAGHLQDRGLSLLESAVGENYGNVTSVSKSLEYLLQIGSDVNILNTLNVDLLSNELKQLNAAIVELEKSANPLPIDLSGVFSKPPVVAIEQSEGQYNPVATSKNSFSNGNQEKPFQNGIFYGGVTGSNGNVVVKAAMRQSEILEKIRQSGNCRLKDLQDHFKDISERTIRYDIQGLVEKGFIDRLGNGGPSTYYKMRSMES